MAKWLYSEVKTKKGLFYLVFGFALVAWVWNYGLYFLLHAQHTQNQKAIIVDAQSNIWWLWTLVVISPLFEETFFRALPIILLVRFSTRDRTMLLWTVILICSVADTLLHGFEPINFLTINVTFLLLSVVYLKAGGYNRKVVKPLATSCCAHFLYNFPIIISLLLLLWYYR